MMTGIHQLLYGEMAPMFVELIDGDEMKTPGSLPLDDIPD